MKRFIICILLCLVFLLGKEGYTQSPPVHSTQLEYVPLERIPLTEALGPIAPIAASPFFGLALTSGGCMLAQHEVLGLEKNSYLKRNKALGNPYVFAFLLILAIAASIPRFTKVTNSFGTVIGYAEDKAGLLVFLLVSAIAIFGLNQPEQAGQGNVVIQAGLLDIPLQLFTLGAMAINFFVIMTVRFLVDVLVFVSPIPFLDGLLETGKKFFAGSMLLLYMISPVLAFILNIIVLLICFLLFRKAMRTTNFFKHMLIRPSLGRLLKREENIISNRFPGSLATGFPDLKLALPVFPMKKQPKFPRQEMAWLVLDGDSLYLVRRRLFAQPVRLLIQADGSHLQANITAIMIRLRWLDAEGKITRSLSLSREFLPVYGEMVRLLNAEDLGDTSLGSKMKSGVRNMAVRVRGAFSSGSVGKEDFI